MTNYKFNALAIERPKSEKLLLDSLDEMRFDRKQNGIKSSRDKSLVKLSNSPAIRAGCLKTSKTKGRFREILVF